MTQDQFMAALVSTGKSLREHDDVVARVGEKLRELTHEQQFHILFPIAIRSPYRGDFPVLDAAILLKKLSPACPLSCEDAVRALLPEWDPSTEQVPFYLAACFGSERVREAIARLRPDVVEESQRARLDTVAYWLDVFDESQETV